jgi:acylphosphatase
LRDIGGLWLDFTHCGARQRPFAWFPWVPPGMRRSRLQILYTGRVQGVGFRYTVKSLARGFDLTGTVRNLDDGRVELVCEGERDELESFRRAVQDSEVGRFVKHEELIWGDAAGAFRGFEIVS